MTGAGTALTVGLSMAVLGAVIPSANAASVTINAPNAPTAGTVTLTGRVGVAGEVTSVLYAVDATDTTSLPEGLDCSGNGAVGVEDNFNGDGSVGDVLDCEIAGVGALDRSLAGTPGVQVGLVGFANEAAAADLDPGAGTATFVPPGTQIEPVAKSLFRHGIRLHTAKDFGDSGDRTAFNAAVTVALATLGTAPAGPKYIMFLSDGRVPVSDAVLEQLRQSGVRLRGFDIGDDGTGCREFSSLYKMSTATGESCQVVGNPASLAANLTGSQPDAVNGVTVSIDGVSVAANVDAVGGWSANFTLGAGTYTATVRAALASGNTVSAQRTFTVAPGAGGPPPGTVNPGPGSLKATVIKVTRPKPSRAVVPSRVTGRVGRLGNSFKATPKLAGSRVLLQARPVAGAPWDTVGRDKVERSGDFALKWKPKFRLRLMRVVLRPEGKFAGSAAAVPTAKISACKVVKRGAGWSVTCQTTAKARSKVRLLRDKDTIDRARVRKGSFRLEGTGKVGTHSIDITLANGRHIRLEL